LTGQIAWNRGAVQVPALNISLEQVEATAQMEPDMQASLSATAQAGTGALALDGQVSGLLSDAPAVSLQLGGDAAHLINWPEYQIWASPELSIRSVPEGWEIDGRVTVPRAVVDIPELPEDVVVPSDDIRVVGNETEATRPTRYFGEARVTLGEDVRVSLLGLDARLEGDVTVRQLRGRQPAVFGLVRVLEGRYTAYGQRLNIEDGTLRFTGDADNPIVDIRATRTIETFEGPVTAGIHLKGRALNLRSQVFSDPVMAEADALSYLIVGRPLSQASAVEGGLVSNAAVALGLARASRITNQIGQSLGLDQLGLVGDGGDGTALVAGKQINRRLHARYAYGVFSRIGTLLLRYRLSRRVALEASSGERQSLDILYTVEKP
ncbi:MAG: translocation/assembly module TamB domain-containing protein, partial [Xanthomonadales bacterium]|nr:translocation/assembly module TamB domain-containing protein [Xanthomonadales bacterium]